MESEVDFADVALRLIMAVAVGGLIGVDRELKGKFLGIRTLALVSLGAALVCLSTVHLAELNNEPDAISRVVQGVIQGVMTGIGFLGAGAVLQRPEDRKIEGLTTAATVWVAAALGIACGLATWAIVWMGAILTVVVLVVLRPLERWLERRIETRRDES